MDEGNGLRGMEPRPVDAGTDAEARRPAGRRASALMALVSVRRYIISVCRMWRRLWRAVWAAASERVLVYVCFMYMWFALSPSVRSALIASSRRTFGVVAEIQQSKLLVVVS